MTTREYSSTSIETALASGINSTQTSITVVAGTAAGLLGGVVLAPDGSDQFTVALDPDTQNEEIVFITNIDGNSFTISRGEAGTSAISHTGGAVVRHVLTSDDLNFFKGAIQSDIFTAKGQLITSTSAGTEVVINPGTTGFALVADSAVANGIKWAAVGNVTTNGVQALSFKDLTSASNTFPTTLLTTNGTQTVNNKNLTSSTNTFPTTLATLTGTQTLTNKTLTQPKITLQVIATGADVINVNYSNRDAFFRCTNPAATVINIDNSTFGAFQTGDTFSVQATTTGTVTFNAPSVTLTGTGMTLRTQYSAATVICTGSNAFTIVGDLI